MILLEGFFHGDPHPGNIFVDPKTGEVTLLDFGQTKELSEETRLGLARLVVLVAEQPENLEQVDTVAIRTLIESIGVQFVEGADDTAGAAAAMWLFDSRPELPGGYSPSELDAKSPALAVASFPREVRITAQSRWHVHAGYALSASRTACARPGRNNTGRPQHTLTRRGYVY